MKCLFFILSFPVLVFAADPVVDFYSNMEDSTDETTLTTTIANNGSHGTGGSWVSVVGTAIKVSTDKETTLRGPVTVVGDSPYTDAGSTRGWRVPDDSNDARARWAITTSTNAIVVSCFITIGPGAVPLWEIYDYISIEMSSGDGTVCQLDTTTSPPVLEIETSSPTEHSAGFSVTNGQTYWVTFKLIQNGTVTLTAYETVNYTQIGSVSATADNSPIAAVVFGVASPHNNTSATSTYFDDICINWTDTTFPFLPSAVAASGSAATVTTLNAATVNVGQ